MKKILFCLVVAMMATTNMNAQNSYDEHKQEIAISLGGLSNSDIITGFEKIGEALVGVSTDNEKFFGPISAEYFYHLKPWIGVGGIIAYGQMSEDMYFSKKKETKDELNKSFLLFWLYSVKDNVLNLVFSDRSYRSVSREY